ncbi:AI-2E family transporter [Frondihabitans australicus]|uniref:Putative PurR-regulated permease PerM n=1 Tax=Frondihabitans australicus TaxID=386892 RepID=A0A495IGD5_9MICO|nr:AI-2E family transporter [Frondihabitans australicus]RKR75004.1 putative PurR-regulated permease PerM [Frondihabitans australicus]
MQRPTDRALPAGMQIAGAWAWRILAIAGVIALFLFVVSELEFIVIPLMIAILLSALLVPGAAFLRRHGWPRWLATVVPILVVLVVLAGLGFLVVTQILDELPELRHRTFHAYLDVRGFLISGPFHLTPKQLNGEFHTAVSAVQTDTNGLLAGAKSIGSGFEHFFTGLLLTVFGTIILLIDGAAVWRWTVRLFPKRARAAIDDAGHAGWITLTSFVKVQIFVALVNSVGIGLIAAIARIPLAVPIAVAVFLGSFIPVVGSIVTGIIAVFVALVYNGPVIALIMLAGVLFIHLLESQVLQPLVMGNAVKVHPLAVVFAVAGGALLAGIAGALFAVPLVATVNTMVHSIAAGRWKARSQEPGDTPPADLAPAPETLSPKDPADD